MTKQLLLTLLAAASTSLCHAQATLTGANTNPVAGDRFVNYSSFVNPGTVAGGAGTTWNYSDLTNVMTDTITYTACDSNSFAGSNIIGILRNGSTYFPTYYHTNNDSLSENQSNTVAWNNPRVLMRYPFNYGSSFTDSFTYTPSVATVVTRGADTVAGTGYGSLLLPGATYNNTLCIHTNETRWDSVWGFPSPAGPVFLHKSSTYDWYIPGFHTSLMRVSFISDSNTTGITYDTLVQFTLPYIPEGVNQVPAGKQTLALSPNPVSGDLHITFTAAESGVTRISVLDLAGREVALISNGQLNKGENTLTYPCGQLQKGMYLLRVTTGQGSITKKIIVE